MPIPRPLLSGSRREFTLSHLVDGTPADLTTPQERRLLNLVVPPWQRPEVWSEQQKTRFIEGVFLGLGTGYYVVNGLDWDSSGKCLPMAGWLLDGQQRISAIRDFLNGDLVVFSDVKFTDFSKSDQVRFLRTPFPCFQLEYTGDEDVLKELYDRLNFGGTAHTLEQRVRPGGEFGTEREVDMSAKRAANALLELDADLAAFAASLEPGGDAPEKRGKVAAYVRECVMGTWTLTLAARTAGMSEEQVVGALLELEPLRCGAKGSGRALASQLFNS